MVGEVTRYTPGMRSLLIVIALIAWLSSVAPAAEGSDAAVPKGGAFPFLKVDAKAKQVRVECEALRVENPLEFFLCVAGTTEHESVLRSKVKPSHLHAALLMIGLKPGQPVHFSEAANKWLPPHGPPLQLSVEFEKEGKAITLPANRLMRDVKSKKEMPPTTWIFTGSKLIDDTYAADRAGYLVSLVNFELTVIDIPSLASNANESLMWETNLELMPAKVGTPVTLLIEPAGKVMTGAGDAGQVETAAARAPVDQPLVKIDAAGAIQVDGRAVESAAEVVEALEKTEDANRRIRVAVSNPLEQNETARQVVNALAAARVRFIVIPQADAHDGATQEATPADGGSSADGALIGRLRAQWEEAVAPQGAGLREAAKTHYGVITQLRREQQRLIDEADGIQRVIDELEKRYQDLTTPGPE